MNSATPSAPPASPAAGWIQTLSNGPSRRIRPLPTQLSATPPARQRLRIPVSACTWRAARSIASSVTAWIDAAMSISRSVIGPSGCRGGPPKRRIEPARRHAQPLAVLEVRHVEAEGPIGLQIDQMVADAVDVLRLSVRRQPHQLVLAGVDLEAGEAGEGGVQEPQRVREADLVRQLDTAAATDSVGGRRPLPDPVQRENRRLLEGRRKERARRVRLVVLGEDDLPPVARQPARDLAGAGAASASPRAARTAGTSETRAARRRGMSRAGARASGTAFRRSRRSRASPG